MHLVVETHREATLFGSSAVSRAGFFGLPFARHPNPAFAANEKVDIAHRSASRVVENALDESGSLEDYSFEAPRSANAVHDGCERRLHQYVSSGARAVRVEQPIAVRVVDRPRYVTAL